MGVKARWYSLIPMPEKNSGGTFDFPNLISLEAQTRMISGYQSRKFYAYDYSQGKSDEQQGTNACPAFRVLRAC